MINHEDNPEYLNSFLDYTMTILNKSPNTVKEYNYDLATFLKFIKIRFNLTQEDDFSLITIKDIDIKKYLEENYEMKDITQSMLDSFQGSIGKAVILKDKKEQYLKLEELIKNLPRKNIIELVKSAEVLYKSKEEIFEMLDYINIVLLKMAKIDYKYTRCIEIVENTKKRIRQNANYDMCIDYMLFNMWEEIN